MSYCYRTTKAEHVLAYQNFNAARDQLIEDAKKFCQLLGAHVKPIFTYSVHESQFDGVNFISKDSDGPLLNPDLWTKPLARSGNSRRPRKTVPAKLKKLSAELEQIWVGNYPANKVSNDWFFDIMGVNWGDHMFAGGWTIHHIGDALYIKTAVRDRRGDVVEILPSVFQDAVEAHKAAQKEADNAN